MCAILKAVFEARRIQSLSSTVGGPAARGQCGNGHRIPQEVRTRRRGEVLLGARSGCKEAVRKDTPFSQSNWQGLHSFAADDGSSSSLERCRCTSECGKERTCVCVLVGVMCV